MGQILFSAAHKSSGKTIVTTGICAALRAKNKIVQPFKKGAFIIAQESKCKIVPISISGTGKLMPPNRGETWLERGEDAPVSIVFHDPIDPVSCSSLKELQEKTRQSIESGIEFY